MPTVATKLLSLSPIDLLVIVIYFVFVLAIGFYLKRFTSTSEDSITSRAMSVMS